jgi:hypothetical protein
MKILDPPPPPPEPPKPEIGFHAIQCGTGANDDALQ